MPFFAKSLHFLASFLPVHFVVLMRGLEQKNTGVVWIFALLCCLGAAANILVLYRFYRRADGFFVELKSYKKSEENILFYLLSIVPIFVSADFDDIYSAIIFATIYLSVVVVCYTSKYLFVNPILYFAGIRFYDAKIISKTKESDIVILSNKGRFADAPRLRISVLGAEGWYIAAAN